MAAKYFFHEFSPSQQETLARTTSVYKGYLHSLKASQAFKGSMHWKKIKGKEYLYKYRDRYGNGESLGPRSEETETIYADFTRRRRELTAQLASQREQLDAASRFCRAALIHRVPETVIRIVRRLELSDFAKTPLMVIGPHALHAFEFAAEVFIDTPKNSPFWADSTKRLTLAAATPISLDRLLWVLRQADRSFCTLPGEEFQATNKAGFLVRLKGSPGLRTPSRTGRFDASLPTVPAESGDLPALLSAPKFSQVVIGKRGTAATMTVPDPRSLALHQLWLSQQEDREPSRRRTDRLQAMALAELILRYLPQYDFFSSQLRLFPPEVARYAHGLVEGYEFEP
jgi:hypothetical protein